MDQAVILSTARTAIGKAYRGSFNDTDAPTLASFSIKASIEKAGLDPSEIEDVILGAAVQQGSQGYNIGRLAAINSNLRQTTTKILSSLTPREERVLRMRFGIGMNSDHTLEVVGQQFSVTRERIRQIEAKALRKLKHPTRAKLLKSFLDKN